MGKRNERVKENVHDGEHAVEREKRTARREKRRREDDIDMGKDTLKRTGVVWIERGRGTGCTWTMIRAS